MSERKKQLDRDLEGIDKAYEGKDDKLMLERLKQARKHHHLHEHRRKPQNDEN